jgi:chemotaxis protein methyltransferase CheR
MIDKKIYDFFAKYVYKHSGILFAESDYYRLDSRLAHLVRHYDAKDVDEVYQKFVSNITSDMHDILINLFTNNETFFMRDMKPFRALAKNLMPKILEEKGSNYRPAMWSCASSSGQEVYSIYMSLESFGKYDPKNFTMDASDISKEILAKAKSGHYTGLEVQRGLPAPFLVKYFDKDETSMENHWFIKQKLRDWPMFKEFNLLTGTFPTAKYDIIFCRNVLIYQDTDNKRAILTNIHKALKPGGYLVFGAGESMIGMRLPFQQVMLDGAIFYQKTEE